MVPATMAISDQVLAEGVFVHDVARVRPVDGLTRIHCGFDSFNVHVGLRYVFVGKKPKHRALARASAYEVCKACRALPRWSGRVSRAAAVVTSDAGQNGNRIHTLTVRHEHPQLEGDDFGKTSEGLETLNRTPFRPTNLQAHITRNAAARERQAAAQIDRCCRAKGSCQHFTRCFGRSCHEPRPKRCGPLLAERAAYHAGTAFGRDAIDTLVACRDGLPDRQQQTREQVELCRGGSGQLSASSSQSRMNSDCSTASQAEASNLPSSR